MPFKQYLSFPRTDIHIPHPTGERRVRPSSPLIPQSYIFSLHLPLQGLKSSQCSDLEGEEPKRSTYRPTDCSSLLLQMTRCFHRRPSRSGSAAHTRLRKCHAQPRERRAENGTVLALFPRRHSGHAAPSAKMWDHGRCHGEPLERHRDRITGGETCEGGHFKPQAGDESVSLRSRWGFFISRRKDWIVDHRGLCQTHFIPLPSGRGAEWLAQRI